MTEQQTRPAREGGNVSYSRSANGAAAVEDAGRGMGWVRFGGVMMAVIGAFAVIEGVVGLIAPTYYVTVGGTVLAVSITGWAWLHIILGALVLVTGLALLGGAPDWARVVGVALVAISMIVQLAWLPAYPIWSILMFVLCAFVLYALIVTWGDKAQA